MSIRRTFIVLVLGGMILSISSAVAQDRSPAVVLEWNTVLQTTAAVGAGGPLQARSYAMVHIAMFDAANSIERRYTPFHATVDGSAGASPEAAAAQAARDVMTGLFGPQAAFDATLQTRLASIPAGRRMQGVAIGRAAAQRVLDWRAADGVAGPASVYTLPLLPGLWQPFPPGAPTGLTQVPRVMPFTLTSVTQFLAARHPELDSAHYAADFNEVKLVGSVTSATRTPDQTQVALLWAGTPALTSTNLFQVWNSIMRDTVTGRHLTLLEAALAFARLNVSMFDGILTSQSAKFVYGLWRPWDAIRRADDDANAGTDADLGWSPLLGTPPYPAYPGNMACLGAAAARVLQLTAGTDSATVHATWKGMPPNTDFTRHYTGYWQVALEEADSRIWGGIHFRFDNVASQTQCVKVADWVHAQVVSRR